MPRTSIFFIAGVAACLIWPGCKSAQKPQPAAQPEKQAESTLMKTANLKKVYLDEMANVFALAPQQKTTLPVAGNLPSGAYKFDHTQVEVKERVIEITPWAQYDPNVMAIQMLIPFTDSVEVGPLPPGEYEIRFNALSGVQKARLEVK